MIRKALVSIWALALGLLYPIGSFYVLTLVPGKVCKEVAILLFLLLIIVSFLLVRRKSASMFGGKASGLFVFVAVLGYVVLVLPWFVR